MNFTVHCLYTVHCTGPCGEGPILLLVLVVLLYILLYTVHCTLYSVQCTGPCGGEGTYPTPCTSCTTIHCTLYTVYCTLYTVHTTGPCGGGPILLSQQENRQLNGRTEASSRKHTTLKIFFSSFFSHLPKLSIATLECSILSFRSSERVYGFSWFRFKLILPDRTNEIGSGVEKADYPGNFSWGFPRGFRIFS